MIPATPATALNASPRSPAWLGWLLPVGFIGLAALLFSASLRVDIPISAAASVAPHDLTPGPRRAAMTDPAAITIDGASQSCQGCHQIFASTIQAPGSDGPLRSFHAEIQLNHGLNDRCTNCHDSADRQSLALRDGTRIPFAATPQLCAQCHGTVYRDWQRGTHGKTLGSWVTHSKDQVRLNCNQCHDPHSPRYGPLAPLPGPRTLRMGDQHIDHGHAPVENPLQRRHAAPPAGDPHSTPPTPAPPHGGTP